MTWLLREYEWTWGFTIGPYHVSLSKVADERETDSSTIRTEMQEVRQD